MITLKAKPVRVFTASTTLAQGKTYLVNGRNIYLLGEIERFIWSKLDGQNTIQQIVDLVNEQFVDVPENVDEDVTQFVETLYESNLIELE